MTVCIRATCEPVSYSWPHEAVSQREVQERLRHEWRLHLNLTEELCCGVSLLSYGGFQCNGMWKGSIRRSKRTGKVIIKGKSLSLLELSLTTSISLNFSLLLLLSNLQRRRTEFLSTHHAPDILPHYRYPGPSGGRTSPKTGYFQLVDVRRP